jgi:hypothetical protein
MGLFTILVFAGMTGIDALRAETAELTAEAELAADYTRERRADDYAALQSYRPGYAFWQHVFTIPDGHIAYGSARDGRLLAVFPTKGDWTAGADWKDPGLAHLLDGVTLVKPLDDRREQVAALLSAMVGPVLHNPTRGQFLLPNARRYGRFLDEWGAIYERFGVPAEIGLAQAAIESGLNGTRRSEARAIGFCQWLLANWRRLNTLAPAEIEAHNQTTQAPYCAAYLSVLATKYGSFIPALSEHHSGGTNVGRTLISGERLGGEDIRDRYFMGSQFARDLRQISLYGYRDIYRTYGPRSYAYSEMVFGNGLHIRSLAESTPQVKIHAMRTTRAIPLAEITQRTRLSTDEVRRFNPALHTRVPARATLYLPAYVKEFGADVAFWHRPPEAAYAALLNEFLRLDATEEDWEDPSFESVLRTVQKRFAATRTEEGTIMATVLAYVIDETYRSKRGAILAEFRESDAVLQLFRRAVVEWESLYPSRDVIRASNPIDAGPGNGWQRGQGRRRGIPST